ncbi:TPA: hypothetical protein HH295_16190 [Xanthomonas vasicola pv. zeae]|uniref:Uncharacterized protein n=7 Tax=Xanthomonas TaxID=338 RepID=A0A836P0Y1_XANVA|nr:MULTISPECIES: hypothetical protein [Xanthomonas]MBV6780418.1 hypothetical protein [Xanthomonas campestris pv. trichodesmae]OOW65494.1 hypothetical protein Xths_06340 [Xanthomonas campestris pv. thespesiae]OOW77683.1 hypothetical protein Xlen_16550 [Xanthomonas campestris pv. leeana]CAD7726508.1 hypothetical protein LMG31884_39720 [Xanthomonas hydrangeae]AMU99987.1 hypothetical protein TP37_19325 [Xanthomonas citri pv. aurantifolii]
MTDDIHLTISGKRFTLTRAEAEFLAEHLRTAIAQPNLGLHFTHHRPGRIGEIVLTRGTPTILTDC